MSENDAVNRIKEVLMPDYYFDYYSTLSKQTYSIFEKAALAKSTLVDSSGVVEPKIAFDLADRVAKMHDIDIADPLRQLLKTNSKELSALILSKDIALGKYSTSTTLEDRLELAVRVGLAIVTEGVTIAPLQGISTVKIKQNKDGSEYLSVSIAGPMRSAGGTESAVTMLIADHVRKTAGLSKYQANSFDDETGRFIEELRIYEREASSFQFHVPDEDIVTVISNLPVELDGVDTDPFEVVNHKNMKRIKTDRVRGGALRVLNDGLIGRAKKLIQRIEQYNFEGWEWLNQLRGAIQTGDQENAAAKRMQEVIVGRSVLSIPNKLGGFRLRYGRACNTGFASVGIHPVVAEILNHTITVGTQIKLDIPSKGATIAFVDSLETPTVRLKDGSVVKIQNTKHGIEIKNEIEKILHLGDILISFGDFLENNAFLVPTAYVEEIWSQELQEKLPKYSFDKNDCLGKFLKELPTFDEAIDISLKFQIPLHPHYLYYWDQLTTDEFKEILQPIGIQNDCIYYPTNCKSILEKLGTPHKILENSIILNDLEAKIFFNLLFRKPIGFDNSLSVMQMITKYSGIQIRNKFSTSIGVRIGRPEKASPRLMKPPVHVLFPVGGKGGATRDLLKASNTSFYSNIHNRVCKRCDQASIGIVCNACGERTIIIYTCPSCRDSLTSTYCPKCKKQTIPYSYKSFPLKNKLLLAQEKTGIRAQEPFKGVKELISQEKIAEPLEKGLIRQNFTLSVFKDGTVRFDATNCPLTHFKPAWIGISIEKLKDLGYTHDKDGQPITNTEQLIELRIQDIILPYDCGKYLVQACKYIDRELTSFYGKEEFYNVKTTDDLIGQLIIGLAPHTSVGIVGRIIGFTQTHVCFANPIWHSAKRRDADGDADSIILLMDGLLNFSRQFLSDKIGGLMDAPLLVQPIVLPHESQPQALNFEVTKKLPRSFYESTSLNEIAANVTTIDILKSRLETKEEFYGYDFTHDTSTITTSKPRSAYSTLGSMTEKLDLQIRNADLINALDTNEIVSRVITTHLLPDIMGNLRAYARQSFRCTLCGRSFRRMPLLQRCVCGNNLIQTITRASVEKYLKLAKRLVEKYEVNQYLKGRIQTLSDEIDLVFGKNKGDQLLLTDYA